LSEEKVSTRESILKIAAHMFWKNGYSSTSMRDIAAKVGIPASTLYYYFVNKQDILENILSKPEGDLGELADIASSSAPIDDRLRAILRWHFLRVIGQPDVMGIESMGIIQTSGLSPEFWEKRLRFKKKSMEFGIGVITEGVQAGLYECESPHVAMWCYYGMLSMVPTWFNPNGRLSAEQMADFIVDMFMRGLRPPQTQSANS